MKKPKPLVGPRPTGKRVLKEVELSNGRVILFEVLVIDPPEPAKGPRQARPKTDGDGGRVSIRGGS